MSDEKFPDTKASRGLLQGQIKKMEEDIEKVGDFIAKDPDNEHLKKRLGELKWHHKNAMNKLAETDAVVEAEFSKKSED